MAFQVLPDTDSVVAGKRNASVHPVMGLGPVSVMLMFATKPLPQFGVAPGLPGLFGSIVVPGSALISLRMISSPAPEVVLSSRLKACCCSDEGAFITADAWPNASAKPNPAMAWCVVEGVMVALSAASAGTAGRTTP